MTDKTNLWELDVDPDDIDNIDGNDTAELCLPSAVNNATRALASFNKKYALDMAGVNTVGGTADAITITTAQTIAAYVDGLELSYIAGADNTGAATVDVDGVGVKSIEKMNDGGIEALDAKDTLVGGLYSVRYQASTDKFILRNPQTSTDNAVDTDAIQDAAITSAKKTAATIAKDEGFKDVPTFKADTALNYSVLSTGDIVKAGPYKYEVLDTASSVFNKTGNPNGYTTITAGSLKTRLLPNEIGAISLEGIGAVGDNTADDTAAIQLTFDYAGYFSYPVIEWTNKIYKYTSNITVGAFRFYGNVTLNGTSGAYFTAIGTLTEIGYVSAAENAQAKSVTLSTVSGLAAGDLIILHNTLLNSQSAHREEYTDGEFCKIQSISGADVEVQNPLLTSYAGVATDKVYLSSGIKVCAYGPSFLSDGLLALRIMYGQDCVLIDTTIKTTATVGTTSALTLDKCYNTVIRSGLYHTPLDVGGGGSYGINVVNSQKVLIDQVDAYGGRHPVTTGGDAALGSVPCRFVEIINSILTNDPDSGVYAADFHGNTVDSYYRNCVINGSVGLAGERVGMVGCSVTSWPNWTNPPLGYHELVGGTCLFKDNKVFVGDGSTATKVVGNLDSGLAADISRDYEIVVDGLDAKINASITSIVNAYENSGQANKWQLANFDITGTVSGLVDLIKYTKAGSGVDADYVYVDSPRLDVSSYTMVSLSGTTLASTIRRQPSFKGSNSNGSYTKYPDGSMVCEFDFSATDAISTAFLGGYRSGGHVWTFPATDFVAAPKVTITADDGSCFGGVISSTGATSVTMFLTAISSQGSTTISAHLVARGRWY